MRIVHIITRMIVGGAQENTLYNCLDLVREHGDDVTLITGPSLGAEGKLIDARGIDNLKVLEIPSLIRAINPLHDVRAMRELKSTLWAMRPDVVHTHSAKAGLLGRAAAWSLNVPCVVHTVHGAPFHAFQPWVARSFFQRCERWAARRCHHMISVADAMTDLMVEANIAPREKFSTIYSGMEVEPFLAADEHRERVRQELGFRPEHVVIGKIARLFHLKGHEYVLQAARDVVKRAPNVRFLFVGDGLLREPLGNLIKSYGLDQHVCFTGLVRPEQIPELVGAMDMLVHASLREGLARALPQALIAGKPVISYDIDGAREVVIDGVTGYLLPPRSVEPMGRAMLRLAEDTELRMRLGAEGRARFQDVFRHERMTDQIRALYDRILTGGPRQTG